MSPPAEADCEPLRLSIQREEGPIQQWKDIERYRAIAEYLRKIGVLALAPGGGRKAHEILDDMLKELSQSTVRVSDVHIRDTGIGRHLVEQFKRQDIHTIQDLASCEPSQVLIDINVMDVLRAMKLGLQLSISLTQPKY